MTRWGLLADIHGNLPALKRALAVFKEREVEKIAVLGDNLGRGDADACMALIREVAAVSVLGNRDLDWQDRVSADSKAYVLRLPRVAQDGQLLFSHGDARLTPDFSTNDIPRGFARARAAMDAADARFWLFGHSHRARVWRLDSDPAVPSLLFDAAMDALPARIQLAGTDGPGGSRWIINAGSVGLPFPGKGPASAAILEIDDGGEGWIEFFAVSVDSPISSG